MTATKHDFGMVLKRENQEFKQLMVDQSINFNGRIASITLLALQTVAQNTELQYPDGGNVVKKEKL